MKVTIDTAQSPQALLNELTQVIRFTLGPRFYIEEDDASGNFTAAEIAESKALESSQAAHSASANSTLPNSGATALPNANGALPNANGVELDSEGHPYDVRIHSAGKSKIGNGTWKLKKGVDKALVEQVNAQNKSLLGSTLPTTTPAPSNVISLPNLPPVNAVAALPELPPVAQVAPASVEIVVTDYPTFAQYVAQQLVAKPVAAKRELDKGLTHYGFVDAAGKPDLTALQHRPDAVMPLYQWYKAIVALAVEG